jgi:photosystem II stability/assembly factor-like uncharacterized protein
MRLLAAFLALFASSACAQWEKIDVPTTASFRGLSVVSDNIVWASGTEGTVVRTVDDGKHWSVITVPGAEKLDFRGIRAFDANNVVIISSGPAEKGQARIYRTQDGGATWKQVFEEKRPGIFFDAVAFWDRKHGIVLSDPVDGKFALFATEDGGETWKQLPPSALPPALPNEGAFAASNSCLTVQGAENVWFATGGASVARVFRSQDRGETWSVAETPMKPTNASSGIFSLLFQDATHGAAVGGDYAHSDSSTLPNMMQSHDGGKTWQAAKATEPPGMYFSSVTPLPQHPDGLVAVGTKGAFLFLSHQWFKGADQNLNAAVAGKSGRSVWVIGPKGTFGQIGWVTDLRPTNGQSH